MYSNIILFVRLDHTKDFSRIDINSHDSHRITILITVLNDRMNLLSQYASSKLYTIVQSFSCYTLINFITLRDKNLDNYQI